VSGAPPPDAAPAGAAAPLRVLIVDDEPLARRGVRARLLALGGGGLEIVGECAGGRDAVRAIGELAPDLVFLDVQMPGLDGFGVIEAVGAERMPAVVFVTAYDQHALRAFDAHALDYLLKPIDDERFAVAVSRARQRVAERRSGARADALAARLAAALAGLGAPAAAPESASGDRLVVRDRGRVLLIDPAEVDWVEAEGDYVRLHVGGRGHLHRETMAAMEARLGPRRFARIHRSAIVNVDRVREVRPRGDREYTVVLRDGTRLGLSRGYRDRMRALLGGPGRGA
jgi:two-component system LytT family response regulator